MALVFFFVEASLLGLVVLSSFMTVCVLVSSFAMLLPSWTRHNYGSTSTCVVPLRATSKRPFAARTLDHGGDNPVGVPLDSHGVNKLNVLLEMAK